MNWRAVARRMAGEVAAPDGPRDWRRFLGHELAEYGVTFAFLAAFLVAFAWYRRLILAEYHIQYLGYWAPLIEAAILAKVILIGDALHVGRRLRRGPKAVTVLYRSLVFSALVVLFSFAEHMLGAVMHGKPMADGIAEVTNRGADEMLAWMVVIFTALLPFFALREVQGAFGVAKLRALFFRGDGTRDRHSPN